MGGVGGEVGSVLMVWRGRREEVSSSFSIREHERRCSASLALQDAGFGGETQELG